MTDFVTAINCIDGRIQSPISRYLKNRFNAQYVDMITCSGPVNVLSCSQNAEIIKHIRDSVEISICKHGSRWVAVVAHWDCAANDLPKQQQLVQHEESLRTIQGWGVPAMTIGLWVNRYWTVEEIAPLEHSTGQQQRHESVSYY